MTIAVTADLGRVVYSPAPHPAGRALTSDWSVNCFIMVVYENILLVVFWT